MTAALTYRDNSGVQVNLEKLIASRMLLTANSGGGKSHAIRQLLEETHGRVQHIVLDREGEFGSLREKYPYLLVGPGGEVAPTLQSAPVLARKLLELGVSVIVDLSEMALPQQRQYVAAFFTAISEAPRALWHDALIVLDEGHLFAPQKFKKGEKYAADSLAAVTLAASIWRKRGFCLAVATQRVAKLDNDVAAELLNKMIGRTSEEDRKRAGDELGMNNETSRGLRKLAIGEFWVYGPAITDEPVLVHTPKSLKTHPPKRGAAREAAPPTPAAIRAIADALAELPKEAAEEERTIAGLKAEVAKLRREVNLPRKADTISADTIKKAMEQAAAAERVKSVKPIRELEKALELAMKFIVNISTANFDIAGVDKAEVEKAVAAAVDRATKIIADQLEGRARNIRKLKDDAAKLLQQLEKVTSAPRNVTVDVAVTKNPPFSVASPTPRRAVVRQPTTDTTGALRGLHLDIINALAELAAIGIETPNREQVAFYLGKAAGGGYFVRVVGELNSAGFVTYPSPGLLALTEAGASQTATVNPPTSIEELHARVRGHLNGLHREIFDVVAAEHPNPITRADVGARLGKAEGGGYFVRVVGELKTAGILTYPEQGSVRAADTLFPSSLV